MTILRICRSGSMLLACACVVAGCKSQPAAQPTAQNTRPTDGWSSKEESTAAAMPDRPEVNLGPAFAVMVDETNLRLAAIDILQRAVDSTNPLLRMNAIQGLRFAPELAPDAIRKGLGDTNRAVRFVSTMLVGEMRLVSMRPLVEPLLLG